MMRSFAIGALLICGGASSAASFQPSVASPTRTVHAPNLRLHLAQTNADDALSRRAVFDLAAKGVVSSSLLVGMPRASYAAPPAPADLQRLQLGHSRVQYLLKNWDALTETCNNKSMSQVESRQVVRTEGGGGGFCDKNPLIVQDYLGYKSTKDPLFKADALMLKAVPLVNDSVMDESDYVDLVEQYREKADQTSLLAYTSSWGEANPNGGKEAVDDYLDKTKEVVMETEVLLRKVLKALDLEVMPPSQKA